MYGMRASTSYSWRPVATDGSGTTIGAWRSIATRALPAEISTPNMTTSALGVASAVQGVLLNYGCDVDYPKADFILVIDTSGYVTWYQDPREDLGITGAHGISALNISRPDKHILVTVDHEYVLEYGLDGSLLTLYCRDADISWSGQECVEPTVAPDAYLPAYPHHDVVKTGGYFYILGAEQVTWTGNPLNCEDEGDVNAGTYAVGDRVDVIDEATDDLVLSWPVDVGFDYTDTCTAHADCDNSYWKDPDGYIEIEGCDVLHTNSIWVDEADQWTLSLKAPSAVVGVDASTILPALSWTWDGWDGTGPLGVYGDFDTTSGSYDTIFHDRHAVAWLDPLTDDMLLFDNHYPPADATTPTRAIRVNWSGTDPEITAQYTLEDGAGDPLASRTGGSVLDIAGTEFVLAYAGDDHPVANEFGPPSGTIGWSLEVECSSGVGRSRPGYRGYPFGW